MSRPWRWSRAWIPVGLMLAGTVHAGPAEAERQYRVARRLAAEKSPDAVQALQRVVELDPEGALADDATLDEALLGPLPRWPEELGVIGESDAKRGLALTGRVLQQFPEGDRISEARYHRALLLLEPLSSHDSAKARLELVTVSTDPAARTWARRARYAVAWLAWRRQDPARAAATFQRLYIDAPDTEVAARAAVGLGRQALRERDFGRAATWFQRGLEGGGPGVSAAGDYLELAVRSLLRDAGGTRSPASGALHATNVRALGGFAASSDGGAILADRKENAVIQYRRGGGSMARWPLADPTSVAASTGGRNFVAAGQQIYRIDPNAGPRPLAGLGDWAPALAMAAEETGAVWVLDRRGERLGRIPPGGSIPELVVQERGLRLGAIAWDAGRLLGIDGRAGRLVSVARDGSVADIGGALERPQALAVDASGTIAVLDTKAGAILLLDPRGGLLARQDYRETGLGRPAALAFSNDGILHVFDESNGSWQERP